MTNLVEFKIDKNRNYENVVAHIKSMYDNIDVDFKNDLNNYYEKNKVEKTKSWFSSRISEKVISYDDFYDFFCDGTGCGYYIKMNSYYDERKYNLYKLYKIAQTLNDKNVDRIFLDENCAKIFHDVVNNYSYEEM